MRDFAQKLQSRHPGFLGKHPEEPFLIWKLSGIRLALKNELWTRPDWPKNTWWVREPSYERGRVLMHPYSPDSRIGLLFRKCLKYAIFIFYSNFRHLQITTTTTIIMDHVRQCKCDDKWWRELISSNRALEGPGHTQDNKTGLWNDQCTPGTE